MKPGSPLPKSSAGSTLVPPIPGAAKSPNFSLLAFDPDLQENKGDNADHFYNPNNRFASLQRYNMSSRYKADANFDNPDATEPSKSIPTGAGAPSQSNTLKRMSKFFSFSKTKSSKAVNQSLKPNPANATFSEIGPPQMMTKKTKMSIWSNIKSIFSSGKRSNRLRMLDEIGDIQNPQYQQEETNQPLVSMNTIPGQDLVRSNKELPKVSEENFEYPTVPEPEIPTKLSKKPKFAQALPGMSAGAFESKSSLLDMQSSNKTLPLLEARNPVPPSRKVKETESKGQIPGVDMTPKKINNNWMNEPSDRSNMISFIGQSIDLDEAQEDLPTPKSPMRNMTAPKSAPAPPKRAPKAEPREERAKSPGSPIKDFGTPKKSVNKQSSFGGEDDMMNVLASAATIKRKKKGESNQGSVASSENDVMSILTSPRKKNNKQQGRNGSFGSFGSFETMEVPLQGNKDL